MFSALKFPITADNRTAAAFGVLKSDLKGIKGVLIGVGARANKVGRAMRNIGLGLTAGVTAPLLLFAGRAASAFDEQAKAQAAVQQALLSTKGAAGKTADELFRAASGLQAITTFGDENILRNVTAPLLTFTKVSGPIFDRAQRSILDMSTLLKIDLKSASLLAGKALNDPIAGLSALGRSGITFSEDQKKVIKALVATGDVAAAQALILDELETQFGGQAAAAAKAGLGPLDVLRNAIGDLKEELGAEVVSFLPGVVEKVKTGVVWFAKLSPEVKNNIVLFGGLAAAAGPALATLGLGVLGVQALSGALIRLGVAAWASLGPWGILAGVVVAAAGYFLVFRDNAAQVKTPLEESKDALDALNTAMGTFSTTVGPQAGNAAINAANNYFTMATAARDAARSNLALLKSELAVQQGINDGLKFGNFFGADEERIIREDMTAAERELAAASAMLNDAMIKRSATVATVNTRLSEQAEIISALGETVDVTLNGINNLGGGMSGAADNVGDLNTELLKTSQVGTQMTSSLVSGFSNVIRGVTSAKDALNQFLSQLGEGLLTSGLNGLFSNLGIPDILGSFFPSAKGNVFSGGNVVPFARGGVVSGPTLFPMSGQKTGLMGEAGPEAVLPLTRLSNGKLGVSAGGVGGGGQSGSTNVVVQNFTGQPTKTKRERGPGLEERVVIVVGDAIARGGLDGPNRARFGNSPAGVVR